MTVSGRYRGKFPEVVKARGLLANLDNIVLDLNVQEAKDIPIDKVGNPRICLNFFLVILALGLLKLN